MMVSVLYRIDELTLEVVLGLEAFFLLRTLRLLWGLLGVVLVEDTPRVSSGRGLIRVKHSSAISSDCSVA